jgi:hypothetical protein
VLEKKKPERKTNPKKQLADELFSFFFSTEPEVSPGEPLLEDL